MTRPVLRLGRRSLLSLALVPVAAGVFGTALRPLPVRARQAPEPFQVTTTTGMIADLVRNIGGDLVSVVSLMGPGIDPHLYKPSAGDVGRLTEADLVFYNGLHLEGRMIDILEGLETAHPVAENIPEDRLRQPVSYEGNFDPHIWFDVTLWEMAANAVRDELIAFDSANTETYTVNHDAYVAELRTLDAYIREQIARVPEQQRVLITAHDAFGYFGDEYGVEVRGLQGTSTATEASANDIQSLAEFITERRIPAIFVESSVPQATIEAVRAAVNDRGWDVVIGGQLYSDAMGAEGTPEGVYIGMVRANVDTIVSALAATPATPAA